MQLWRGCRQIEGKGFMISSRGMEANPEKIKAIQEMPIPKKIKDIQKITGRVAALNSFLSKSADKCLPFFKILRSQKKFKWDDDCQQAFQELKDYMSTPPLLSSPRLGETLYFYLAPTEVPLGKLSWSEKKKGCTKPYIMSAEPCKR